jgi:hypothetical protein
VDKLEQQLTEPVVALLVMVVEAEVQVVLELPHQMLVVGEVLVATLEKVAMVVMVLTHLVLVLKVEPVVVAVVVAVLALLTVVDQVVALVYMDKVRMD